MSDPYIIGSFTVAFSIPWITYLFTGLQYYGFFVGGLVLSYVIQFIILAEWKKKKNLHLDDAFAILGEFALAFVVSILISLIAGTFIIKFKPFPNKKELNWLSAFGGAIVMNVLILITFIMAIKTAASL
jgi:hypothetical protein